VCDLETTKYLVNEEEAKAHWGVIAPRERERKKIYIYIPSYVQSEVGSKKPKHAAESCKFVKCIIKSCAILYFITLLNYYYC
jgi:hypothetical protein